MRHTGAAFRHGECCGRYHRGWELATRRTPPISIADLRSVMADRNAVPGGYNELMVSRRAPAASIVAALAALLVVGLGARQAPPQGPPPQQPPQWSATAAPAADVQSGRQAGARGRDGHRQRRQGRPRPDGCRLRGERGRRPAEGLDRPVRARRRDSPRRSDETNLEIRSRDHAAAEAAREDVRLFVIYFDDYHIEKLPGDHHPAPPGADDVHQPAAADRPRRHRGPADAGQPHRVHARPGQAARHRPELRGADVRDLPDQERRGGGPAEERRPAAAARAGHLLGAPGHLCAARRPSRGAEDDHLRQPGAADHAPDAGTSSWTFAASPTRRIART